MPVLLNRSGIIMANEWLTLECWWRVAIRHESSRQAKLHPFRVRVFHICPKQWWYHFESIYVACYLTERQSCSCRSRRHRCVWSCVLNRMLRSRTRKRERPDVWSINFIGSLEWAAEDPYTISTLGTLLYYSATLRISFHSTDIDFVPRSYDIPKISAPQQCQKWMKNLSRASLSPSCPRSL